MGLEWVDINSLFVDTAITGNRFLARIVGTVLVDHAIADNEALCANPEGIILVAGMNSRGASILEGNTHREHIVGRRETPFVDQRPQGAVVGEGKDYLLAGERSTGHARHLVCTLCDKEKNDGIVLKKAIIVVDDSASESRHLGALVDSKVAQSDVTLQGAAVERGGNRWKRTKSDEVWCHHCSTLRLLILCDIDAAIVDVGLDESIESVLPRRCAFETPTKRTVKKTVEGGEVAEEGAAVLLPFATARD